jgi:hypothetical protein
VTGASSRGVITSPGRGDVPAVRDELIAAARVRGWPLHVLRNEPAFSRLQINGIDELLVDIALDATPGHPPVASIAGPTLVRLVGMPK